MPKVKILNSCAGNGFSAVAGQIIEMNKGNMDILYAKLRHGTAIMLDDVKKKDLDETRGQNENTNILHDTPPKRKGRRSVSKSTGS